MPSRRHCSYHVQPFGRFECIAARSRRALLETFTFGRARYRRGVSRRTCATGLALHPSDSITLSNSRRHGCGQRLSLCGSCVRPRQALEVGICILVANACWREVPPLCGAVQRRRTTHIFCKHLRPDPAINRPAAFHDLASRIPEGHVPAAPHPPSAWSCQTCEAEHSSRVPQFLLPPSPKGPH